MNTEKTNGSGAAISEKDLQAFKTLTVTGVGAMEAEFSVSSISSHDAGPNQMGVPAGNVRVAVKYAGGGFADVLAVAGGYPLAPRPPFSPGYEYYGTVMQIGPGVAGMKPGDRVCGMLLRMGAYRSVLEVPAELVVKVPNAVSDETAAALPLNYLTALALLERTATLKPGQCFLIHGAGGGVGSATLETAKILGIQAFGTASPSKHAIVRSLGGIPIDYTNGDWLSRALAERPQGFDAVLDSFGGSIQRASWRALSRRGTLVSYGFYPSVQAGIGSSLRGLFFLHTRNLLPNGKRAQLCGTPAIIKEDSRWYHGSMERLLDWARTGRIQPVVDSIVPWNRADEAHRAIRDRQVQGKVLLDFSA